MRAGVSCGTSRHVRPRHPRADLLDVANRHLPVSLDAHHAICCGVSGWNKAPTLSNGFWIALGLTGQVVFCGRFLLQWWYSERLYRSAIPMGFWYASIAGSLLLLGFALYKRDPVFIAGYFGGLLIYSRNLHLRLREAKGNRAGRPG